jgi:hypothetical protein
MHVGVHNSDHDIRSVYLQPCHSTSHSLCVENDRPEEPIFISKKTIQSLSIRPLGSTYAKRSIRKISVSKDVLTQRFDYCSVRRGICIPYPHGSTYTICGEDKQSSEETSSSSDPSTPACPDKVSATDDDVPVPEHSVPPPKISRGKGVSPEDDKGAQAFQCSGKPTNPRSFSSPEHAEKFAWTYSAMTPAAYLKRSESPYDAAARKRRFKAFRQNVKRRYKVVNGHLQYNTAGRKRKKVHNRIRAQLNPWREIPFADEEWGIVQTAHQPNHRCMNSMETHINRSYRVPHMRAIAAEVRRQCAQCNKYAPPNKVSPVWILTRAPMELVMFDLSTISITTSAGDQLHMLLVADHFTKYRWGKLFTSKDAEPISEYLLDLFQNKECTPQRWHADNGSEFKNKFMDAVRLKLSDIEQRDGNGILAYTHSRPRNPQCQGLVERGNYTVKTRLDKSYLDYTKKHGDDNITQAVLEQLLQDVLGGLNDDEVKLYKASPKLLLRGRPGRMSNGRMLNPSELAELHASCHEAQKRQAYGPEPGLHDRDVLREYKVGTVVRLACTTQQMHKKEAPMGQRWPWLAKIARKSKSADLVYYLKWLEQGPVTKNKPGTVSSRAFHVVQLREGTSEEQTRYADVPISDDSETDSTQGTTTPRPGRTTTKHRRKQKGRQAREKRRSKAVPGRTGKKTVQGLSDAHADDGDVDAEEDEDDYEVEALLARRWSGQHLEYLVKWKGYDATEENTWEPESALNKCKAMVLAFNRLAHTEGICDDCGRVSEKDTVILNCTGCGKVLCYSPVDETKCWGRLNLERSDSDDRCQKCENKPARSVRHPKLIIICLCILTPHAFLAIRTCMCMCRAAEGENDDVGADPMELDTGRTEEEISEDFERYMRDLQSDQYEVETNGETNDHIRSDEEKDENISDNDADDESVQDQLRSNEKQR